jgi:hypothetical protein
MKPTLDLIGNSAQIRYESASLSSDESQATKIQLRSNDRLVGHCLRLPLPIGPLNPLYLDLTPQWNLR